MLLHFCRDTFALRIGTSVQWNIEWLSYIRDIEEFVKDTTMYWLSFFKKCTTALFCTLFLKVQTLLLPVFQQCTLSCRKSQNNSFLKKTVRIPEFGIEPKIGSLQRFETSCSDILIVLHQSISARPKEYKIRMEALVLFTSPARF